MGRRLGRKRLYSLNKVGQSVSSSVGAGVSASVGHRKVSRQGQEIVTEITVDLGHDGAGVSAAAVNNTIIGYSSSAGVTNQAAHLGLINRAENGVVTDVEMVCVEAPTGGPTRIQLAFASAATSTFSGSGGTLIVHGNQAVGTSSAKTYDANELEHQYLYLRTGEAAPTNRESRQYTAGKLSIRLYGYATPEDQNQ